MVHITGEWPAEFALQLAVRNSDDVEGGLANAVNITPVDFVWAPILVYAEYAAKTPGHDDMQRIRRALLTVPVTFHKHGADNMQNFWSHFAFRTRTAGVGEAMKCTHIQKATDIWESKVLYDKQVGGNVGAEACSKL